MQRKNVYLKRRRVECAEKSMKRGSQEDVDKLVKRAQLNHGDFDEPAEAIAQRMVSSGEGGDAFNHIGMQMGDLDEFLQSTRLSGQQTEADEEVESDTTPEGDGQSKAVPGQEKKAAWFDRDRSINAARKWMNQKIEIAKDSHTSTTEALKGAIARIDAKPPSEKQHYTGERTIAGVRLAMMQKLTEPEGVLEAHIKMFKVWYPYQVSLAW